MEKMMQLIARQRYPCLPFDANVEYWYEVERQLLCC